ncbi:serine/threonine protein kinase [Actinocorallia sp. API 0066]|nr:serine/threonine protein kinase [Actinocorallia sp. API 0066]
MGVVHLAWDLELERAVAVKVLPSGLVGGDAHREARFRREARAAAGLSHPNIVTVHDAGVDMGGAEAVPYLVMELVEGDTLAELLVTAPPDPGEAARIVLAVLDALAHSHARGVVHRDVKPGNVMVRRDGGRLHVKVMDFGVARLLSEAATALTADGTRIGTPVYMSPEQVTGEPVGPASDLYSTGCVLYQLLTGRPPFVADTTAALLYHHLHSAPAAPTERNPALPSAWDAVLATALAKDPAQRYPDAAAMRRAVEAAAGPAGRAPGEEPTRVDPPAPTVPGARRVNRRRALGLGAVAAASAAVPAAFLLDRERRAPGGAPRAVEPPVLLRTGEFVMSVAFSPDGATLATGGVGEAVRLWRVADLAPVGRPLTGHGREITSVAFSPDGAVLVSAARDGTARLWRAVDGARLGRPLGGHTGPVNAVAFSPDGRTLATGGDDASVRLWRAADRAPLGEPLTGHTSAVFTVAFSHDGTLLASGGTDRTARVWHVAERAEKGIPLVGHTSSVNAVAFAHADAYLTTGGDELIRRWNLTDHNPLGAPLTGHTGHVTSVVFSRDGRTLATAGSDTTVRLWRATAPTRLDPLPSRQAETPVSALALTHDGALLAAACEDETIRLWRL